MRWQVKTKIDYKENDIRVKKLYCIIPTKVDGYWYWLESIHVVQKYIKFTTWQYEDGEVFWDDAFKWRNIRLVTNE